MDKKFFIWVVGFENLSLFVVLVNGKIWFSFLLSGELKKVNFELLEGEFGGWYMSLFLLLN